MTGHEFDNIAERRQRHHRRDLIEELLEQDYPDLYEEEFHSSDDESRDNEP
jgi:hypothetical protein